MTAPPVEGGRDQLPSLQNDRLCALIALYGSATPFNSQPHVTAGVVFPPLLWQCRKMGNDDFLGLGDALLDVRRFVEYGSLSIDSCRSIPEKDPMPQTYERIREGEMGEGWTMRSAV
jgi:hypothetical protein